MFKVIVNPVYGQNHPTESHAGIHEQVSRLEMPVLKPLVPGVATHLLMISMCHVIVMDSCR